MDIEEEFKKDKTTKSGIHITSFVSVVSANDSYPTHKDTFGKGGYRSVYDLAERDAISMERRKIGMLVFVFQKNTVYTLLSGLENKDWIVFVIDRQLEFNNILIGDVNDQSYSSVALQELALDILYIKNLIELLKNRIYAHLQSLHTEQTKHRNLLEQLLNVTIPVYTVGTAPVDSFGQGALWIEKDEEYTILTNILVYSVGLAPVDSFIHGTFWIEKDEVLINSTAPVDSFGQGALWIEKDKVLLNVPIYTAYPRFIDNFINKGFWLNKDEASFNVPVYTLGTAPVDSFDDKVFWIEKS